MTRLRRANKLADSFEDRFWSGGSLDELFDREGVNPGHPMACVFAAAMTEWRRTQAGGADVNRSRVFDRIDRLMLVTIGREMEQLKRRTFLSAAGLDRFAARLSDFAIELGVILSRETEERHGQ